MMARNRAPFYRVNPEVKLVDREEITAMNRFLNHIRVLEIGNFISGPYTGQLLAEMGAEVIKIEKPDGGDPFRSFSQDQLSSQFCAYNRGKRSVTADLNTAEGREFLLRLVEGGDVLVENFRPDVLPRLGLGWDVLRTRNSRLIYCNISGFGPDGPYCKRPAYDTVAQSLSGFFSQLLDPEKPRITGPAMADAITGLYSALAIACAITQRERDGKGHRLDVSMVESMIAFGTDPITGFFAKGQPPSPFDRAAASQSFALRCSDDKLIGLHLSSPEKFWHGLVTAIGDPSIGQDPRFANRGARVKHYAALCQVLEAAFARHPRADWERRLEKEDVPHAPILDYAEVQNDPQIAHMQTFYRCDEPQRAMMRGIQSPVWCDGAREIPELPPPRLGHHTEEQARMVGYTADEIAALRAAKAI
jgi:formyl-CoA transferase